MSHNFSFKTKLPTGVAAGVAAGVARPIFRVAVATPVDETRLLATVQMQLDELLTLALTFFFLNTHAFFPPTFREDPPYCASDSQTVGGGKNADGMLNVIGPMR